MFQCKLSVSPPPGNFDFKPLRPRGHWCPPDVIAYIFTIKLLHLLFLDTIDQGKVKNYKNLKKYEMVLYIFGHVTFNIAKFHNFEVFQEIDCPGLTKKSYKIIFVQF